MSDEIEKASPGETGETDNKDNKKRSKATVSRRRRILSLRNFLVAAGIVAAIVAFLAIGTGIAYKTGAVDSYVKGQFVTAFDEMNVSMKSGRFELQLSPLKLYVEKAIFTNKKTGQKLIAVENMAFDLSVLDLLAMSTTRNVSIDRADVNGIDIWIDFDKNGKSNFEGIEILPPKNNVRLQYSAAEVALRNGRIHFGDELHSIRGNARELSVFLKPDTVRPADSDEMSFLFDLASKESNFFYDDEEIKPVDIKASGRLHPEGAEISNLELKSPLGDSVLSGRLLSWESLAYDLKIKSTLDLTRTSTVFPMGTAISGVGNFEGTVSGKGSEYKIRGEVTSDSLAADNIRLKALKVTADADGEGSMYRANGKAVAELLTFEDYRIAFPSLVGTVRGSGADFKWFGELQAASLKSPLGSIGSLIISDAVAEYEDNRLAATLGNVRARKFTNDSVNLESIQTGNIRIVSSNGSIDAVIPRATAANLNVDGAEMRDIAVESARVKNRGGTTSVTADSARLSDFQSGNTKLKNARASGIEIVNRDGRTGVTAARIDSDEVTTSSSKTNGVSASNVTVDIGPRDTRIDSPAVRIARVDASSAVLSNLNIAGVRLTVRDGIIEGETADFEAGDVDLKGNGKLQRVAVKRPVFVLEPSGRYRASLDMSLGGGVIGSVTLGSARASVVADNDIVELNSLSAEVMNGKIDGNAKIALAGRRRSEVRADFRDLDISKLLALQGGRVVPLEGKTNGRADLTFSGTNLSTASGTLTAEIDATAGTEDNGFIPVDGRLGVSATNGLVDIDYASLQTTKSTFTADGRFDLNGDDSDLSLALDSTDAAEIERIVRVTELSPELEQQLDSFEISPMGALAVNGRLTGNLSNPRIDGRASLASLVVRGRDLGSVVANMANDQSRFSVTDGVLQARDGGSVRFGIEVPWGGSNNIDLQASLNDIDLANLIVLIPRESIPERLRDVEGTTTGNLSIAGIPNNLSGTADLFTRNGSINGQSFENLTSNAVFEGQTIKLNKFDAGFGQGTLSATGFYKADTTEFDVDLSAKDIPASKLLAFVPRSASTPDIDGDINLTANATGRTDDTGSYNINFNGTGSGVSINQSRFGKIDFAGRTENKVLNATATTNLAGRSQLITARLDFADENLPFRAETNFERSPVGPYLEIFRRSDPDAVSITGEVTGGVSLAGNLSALNPDGTRVFTWDNLSGLANLSAASFQFDETPLTATEPVVVSFNTSEVVFENAKFAGGGSNLVISGKKAFTDSGINNLAIDGKVNLGIVRAFSRNTLKNIFLSGLADIEIRLSGVNRTSRLNGTAILENGSAATFVGANRISFERVNGRIRFTTNQVQIEQVTAFLGGGKVTASGGALLADDLSLDRIRIEIRGTNITVPLPDDFVTTGNANIEISGRREGNSFASLVAGTVVARRSVYRKDIDLADLISGRRETALSQSTDAGTAGTVNFAAPRLDIRIIGREALRVRNNLADLTASADMRLTGDTEVPRLSGRITATSGTIFFRDDRYEVQRGVLTFPPNTNIDPRINLQVESEIRGYQVFVNLSGNLSDPDSFNAVVTSNPSLPQADVTSLITTGSLANTSDGIPTIAQGGLNTAAEILTDEIINKPIARATDKLFGLNRFALDPIVSGQKGNPTARLTVGRQINRNLLATYSTNLSQDQNQVLALEYRVSNRLSFVAAYEQRSLTNVTQSRNKFSFEIRLRKRF